MTENVIGFDISGNHVSQIKSFPAQMTLFQEFLPEVSKQYSNIIDFWDSVPKYSTASKKIQEMRDQYDNVSKKEKGQGRHLPVLKRTFRYKIDGLEQWFHVKIHPARVEEKEGFYRDYYPSEREELVEDALKKLACDKQNGVFLNDQASVIFTLYELQEELTQRGHTINYRDLRRSLTILKMSEIAIERSDGATEIESAILPVFYKANRQDWLKNSKNATCYAQFHPLITRSIKALNFRQFNYIKYMEYKSQLTRWFHKRLVERFTYAAPGKVYEISESRVIGESGLVNSSEPSDRRKTVINALSEMVKSGTLIRFDRKNILGKKNRIEDVIYSLWASTEFSTEIWRANTRAKNYRESRTIPQL